MSETSSPPRHLLIPRPLFTTPARLALARYQDERRERQALASGSLTQEELRKAKEARHV